MKLLTRTVLFPALLIGTLAHGQEIRTGDALLRAMHDRYQATWYKTLTFTQKSTTYKPDGTNSAETWYEAAMLPGKLRIDIGPASGGNGYVLVDRRRRRCRRAVAGAEGSRRRHFQRRSRQRE